MNEDEDEDEMEIIAADEAEFDATVADMMADHEVGFVNDRGRVTEDGIFTPWGWPE